jgi:membrane protein
LLIIGAFTFIYKLVPNTQVRLKSAFVGAVFTGLLWESVGWLFTAFVANSSNYTAVYSGFAVLIVFMIWLYLSWMILLIGSSISFYHQHPECISDRQQVLRLSCRLREKLALLIMHHIADSFHNNKPYWNTESLADKLDVATDALTLVLNSLEDAGVVIRSGDKGHDYVPAQSLEKISLSQILDAVRAAEETSHLNPDDLNSNQMIDEITSQINLSYQSAMADKNLRDLIDT